MNLLGTVYVYRIVTLALVAICTSIQALAIEKQPISLVTGGAGFIGSHVARDLIRMGHRVVVLDDLSGGYLVNVDPKAHFVQGSILDHKLLEGLFNEFEFDYVYHFSAYAAEGLSHFIKRFNYNNNLIGTVNLINESVNHDIKCFVYTSSMSVYGSAKPPFCEEMRPDPEDSYAVAKAASEAELRVTNEMFGMDCIIFRPHNVYGEGQNIMDKYRNVVGIFMRQLQMGERISVFGDGKQTRAFSYIGDISPIIADSINIPEAYNQTINIGADQEYTIQELAEAVMEAMDMNGELYFYPERFEVKNAYSDHTKARRIFGEYKQTPLSEGLKKMADWSKTINLQETKFSDVIEIERNIPIFWQQKEKIEE